MNTTTNTVFCSCRLTEGRAHFAYADSEAEAINRCKQYAIRCVLGSGVASAKSPDMRCAKIRAQREAFVAAQREYLASLVDLATR